MRTAKLFTALTTALLALTAGTARAEANRLESGELMRMAKDLGYDSKMLNDKRCQLTIERDNWKVFVRVELSPNGKYVWLDADFGEVGSPEGVPANVWVNLLRENDKIAPASFTLNGKFLYLLKPVENVGITPARLRKEIEEFDGTVRKTVNVWKPENFKAAARPQVPSAADAPPPAQQDDPRDRLQREELAKLRGTWKIISVENNGVLRPHEEIEREQPRMVFSGTEVTVKINGKNDLRGTIRIDPSRKPASLDMVTGQVIERAIYRLEGNRLTIYLAPAGADRPAAFDEPDFKGSVIVLKRVASLD